MRLYLHREEPPAPLFTMLVKISEGPDAPADVRTVRDLLQEFAKEYTSHFGPAHSLQVRQVSLSQRFRQRCFVER